MTEREPADEWKNREKGRQTSNRWMEKQREMHKMSNRFSNEFKMKKGWNETAKIFEAKIRFLEMLKVL